MTVSWEDVVAYAQQLPAVEESTSYGTPSLKVAGKLMCRLRTEDDGGLAVKCSPTDKEALISNDNPAYYTTPHYDGSNYVLVHLELAEPEELFELVEDAWHIAAPAKVRERRPR
jgi:hypothetical protein